MPHIVIIGRFGSDAGYIWIDSEGHIHRVPGWNPEELLEVGVAAELIGRAATLKTPELGARVAAVLSQFVQSQLAPHAKDNAGGMSVIALP